MGTNCPGSICPGTNCPGMSCPWGRIVNGDELSRVELSLGTNCPGLNCPWGQIVQGRVVLGLDDDGSDMEICGGVRGVLRSEGVNFPY
jgi:hypothetical protein